MNTDKASKLLKKIQALYDNLNDQGSMSALERDLLLSYLRELYDELSSATPGSAVSTKRDPQPARIIESPPPPRPPQPVEPEISYTPPKPEPVVAPKPPEPPQYREPVPASAPPSDIPVQPEPTKQPSVPSPESLADLTDEALEALFEYKQIGELSEKLKMQPLERIEQGMGINERILIINELFGGDSDLFRRTLDELHSLNGFEAAKHHLVSNIATRYQWSEGAKKTQAILFTQLVRRKFLSS